MSLQSIAFYAIVFGFIGYGIIKVIPAILKAKEEYLNSTAPDIDKEIEVTKKQIELKKLKQKLEGGE